jgi:hypothetical protein
MNHFSTFFSLFVQIKADLTCFCFLTLSLHFFRFHVFFSNERKKPDTATFRTVVKSFLHVGLPLKCFSNKKQKKIVKKCIAMPLSMELKVALERSCTFYQKVKVLAQTEFYWN